MIKKLLTFLILFYYSAGFAQNIDSLYSEFMTIKGVKIKGSESVLTGGQPRCGFGTVNAIREHLDELSPERRAAVQSLLTRPETDLSFISPAGYFMIHYDTTGFGVPQYDLDKFAAAADSAYEYEIFTLGYPPPPDDGDGYYDVYLANLGGGLYGYTQSDSSLGGGKFTTYIMMSADYGPGYASHGLNGARVTIAHEFHHSIQMGRYIFRSEDTFYHEITSTAMEEFVFDYVNDYYAYQKSYFRNPGRTFSYNNGYDLAIWNIFLKDKYGFDILKRIWELMPQNRALNAIGLALLEEGSTFQYELADFGVWTYFTNYRAVEGKYFEEASAYPLISIYTTLQFQPPKKKVVINPVSPAANNFVVFPDQSRGFSDTLVTIISNGDLMNAVNNPASKFAVTYSLTTQNESGAVKINDYYYSIIESENNNVLTEKDIFNNEEITDSTAGDVRNEIDYAFPQPFNYSTNAVLFLPAPAGLETAASVSVYSSSMNLIYSGELNIFTKGKITVAWNPLNDSGKKLSSGVYIFAVKAGGKIKKGKFVIINE